MIGSKLLTRFARNTKTNTEVVVLTLKSNGVLLLHARPKVGPTPLLWNVLMACQEQKATPMTMVWLLFWTWGIHRWQWIVGWWTVSSIVHLGNTIKQYPTNVIWPAKGSKQGVSHPLHQIHSLKWSGSDRSMLDALMPLPRCLAHLALHLYATTDMWVHFCQELLYNIRIELLIVLYIIWHIYVMQAGNCGWNRVADWRDAVVRGKKCSSTCPIDGNCSDLYD